MARLRIAVYPSMEALTGVAATREDIANTLSPIPRDHAVRIAINILNSLAVDTHFEDDQAALIDRFEPSLKKGYIAFLAHNADALVRPFHPYQQLVMLHAASRYCSGNVGDLSREETEQRFTRASVQINDLLIKNPPDTRGNTALYLFSEQGPHWDLVNNSHPLQSLGRLRFLLLDLAARSGRCGEAATRLRERFPEYLGLPFETVFNLTGFLIFWWHLHAANNPTSPGSCFVDRRTWLRNSSITREEMDAFLDRISTSPEELITHYDEAGIGMSFRDVMPFRQRPLFRIDEHHLGFICPQLVTEKGGVDLFWLLTNTQPGVREARPWMDDFGALLEGYVHHILSTLPVAAVGGRYESSIAWEANKQTSGEIDGLIHAGEVLVLMEVKGSLVRQSVLSAGDEGAVQTELERKFIMGDGQRAKGLRQLTRVIDWLAVERKYRRSLRGIDLRDITWIIPVLVVADRSLRFPPLSRWFNRRFGSLLSKSWGRIGPLVLCTLEDLEAMEQRAVDGTGSLVSTLIQYAQEFPRAEKPISDVIGPKRNERLRALTDAWIEELQEQKILPMQ